MSTNNIGSLNPSLSNSAADDLSVTSPLQPTGQSLQPNVEPTQTTVIDPVDQTTTPAIPSGDADTYMATQEAMAGASGGAVNNNFTQVTPKKGFNFKFLIIGIVVLIFLFVGSLFSIGALAAYDKVKLPGNLNQMFAGIVSKMGFLPKSNAMILGLMQTAMDQKDSAYIDLSIAVDSPELKQVATMLPGFDKLEIVIKGPFDGSDEQNPKTSLNLSISNLFELDFVSMDNMGFFRVNKLPPFFDSFVNPLSISMIKNKWVEFEYANLGSEASQALDERSEELKTKEAMAQKRMEEYFMQNILPTMKQSSEKVDNFDTYKLQANLSQSQMQDILKIMQDYGATPSDFNAVNGSEIVTIPDATIDLWVDKSEYILRKATMTFKMQATMPGDAYTDVLGVSTASNAQLMADEQASKSQEATFAVVLKMSKYGEKFDIQKPTGTIPAETYMMQLYQVFGPLFGGSSSSYMNDPYAEDQYQMQQDTNSYRNQSQQNYDDLDTMGFE